MFCDINPGDRNPKGLSYLGGRPSLHDAQIKYLELALVDPTTHSGDGLLQQVLFPSRIPFGAEFRHVRVGDTVNSADARISRIRGPMAFGQIRRADPLAALLSPPKLVLNSPPCQVEKPGLETAGRGVVSEFGQVPGYADS